MLQSVFSHFMSQPFGAVACLSQLAVVFCGFPLQVRTIYRQRSVSGVNLPLFALSWFASAMWAISAAFEVGNLNLLLPQIPAIIFVGIIVGQIVYYRRPTVTPASSTVK